MLEGLKPSTNLKELRIDLYGGTSFSSWLGDSLYSNMVSLSISNCEYCVTLPPLGKLPSLKKLMIHGMRIMETIGPEFYGMTDGCSDSSFQPFPSLESLEFENMSNWREWLPFKGNKFPFPHLKVLVFRKCPELRGHLPSHLPSIQHVVIDGCDCLLATPPTLDWLSSIKSVYVGRSLGLAVRTPWLLFACESPCILQHVKIFECDTLPSLPKMVLNSTCFQRLELYNVPSLTEFSTYGHGLPTSLQSLIIQRCKNLAFPPAETWSNYTSLVTLKLGNSCDALISFPLDGFPKLQSLSIKGCKSLESICISESCSSLFPSTLQSFEVKSCKALRSLPQRMDTLIALEKLTLEDLPELELPFCEGVCLPSKLQSISIVLVRRTTHVTEWGLQHLPALSKLHIGGNDDMVKTLLKERLLPISLVSLTITLLSKTKCLDGNGLRHLSSLETLRFYNCTGLESLEFEGCQRLGSLPDDRLPSSLKILTIWQCFQLEERYRRPEHWSKIVHIPVININGQVTI